MRFHFVLPPPEQTAGGIGLAYATGMVAGLRALGHEAGIAHSGDGPPPQGAILVVDGLSLPGSPALATPTNVALMHHVAARPAADRSDRQDIQALLGTMLPQMRRVVCTSPAVADGLIGAGLAPAAITSVIEPGADDLPQHMPTAAPPSILVPGVLTRRKGQGDLLRALARLVDLDWTVTIAGATARDPAYAAELLASIPELGLQDRAEIVANPDEARWADLWSEASLFATASRWEGYPSALMSALRRGIPVVSTAFDGVASRLPPDAGLVCPLDDGPTLSKVLRRVLFSPALRSDFATGAWRAGQSQPDWTTQARLLAASVEN